MFLMILNNSIKSKISHSDNNIQVSDAILCIRKKAIFHNILLVYDAI